MKKKSFVFYGLAAMLMASPATAIVTYPDAETCAHYNPSDEIMCFGEGGANGGYFSWYALAEYPTYPQNPYNFSHYSTMGDLWSIYGVGTDLIKRPSGYYYASTETKVNLEKNPVVCHFDWDAYAEHYTCYQYRDDSIMDDYLAAQNNCAENEVWVPADNACVPAAPCKELGNESKYCNTFFEDINLTDKDTARALAKLYTARRDGSFCELIQTGREEGEGKHEFACLTNKGEYVSFLFKNTGGTADTHAWYQMVRAICYTYGYEVNLMGTCTVPGEQECLDIQKDMRGFIDVKVEYKENSRRCKFLSW